MSSLLEIDIAQLSDDELYRLANQLEAKVDEEKNLQMALKILLNSLYGALGNVGFRYFMLEMAQSVTLSGQTAIQWIERKINELMNAKCGGEPKDRIVLIDTDSVVCDMQDFVEKVAPNHTREQRLKFLMTFSEKAMNPFIEASYKEFGEYINCYKFAYKMKRENIIARMVSCAKKAYMMEVYNSEGVQYTLDNPYMKIMGLKLVKSDTPAVMRDTLRESLPILLRENEAELQKFVEGVKQSFSNFTVEEIAFPKSVSDIVKYDKQVVKKNLNRIKNPLEKAKLQTKIEKEKSPLYISGTPINAKGAIIYNHLIDKLSLGKKYLKIQNGDKIKFVYLKEQNPLGEKVIAFLDTLPPEFGLHDYIDYDIMLEKVFVQNIKLLCDPLGWKPVYTPSLSSFFSFGE